ncbi:MAG TPA: Gfo/Idh/MocA family oxidoreductase [Pseudolabrys sp.]|nr:Gfo/Idh/MocA family oxidoreductase [Pseudolabrys sp.]
MTKTWNVAVIGCGIGHNHIAEGYAKLPRQFRVLALCDLDRKRLQTVGAEFSVERRTASFRDVLDMDDVDIVDICTPPALHVDQSMEALAAGKYVICEKPAAGSLADVDRLIAAEKAARGRLMPVFQYRYGNGLQKAKRIIDAGLAGKPYLATVETAWKRGPGYYEVKWRGHWDGELGGVLLTHAIHSIDILTYLMGPVASVFACTATRVNPIEVEDCAVACLTMRSGALASLAATLGSQNEISRLRFHFERVTFESCLEPYAPGNDPWQIIASSKATEAALAEALHGWRDVAPGFAGLLAAYHEALETGGPLPVTLADARASLELVTALLASSEHGQPTQLPIARDHDKYQGWQPRKSLPGSYDR